MPAGPKMIDLTFEEVDALLAYDPVAGKITWKVTVSRRTKAGDEAGCLKRAKVGEDRKYRYITVNGMSTPAGRFAWMLHYREWPTANLKFVDGDTANIKIANLELSKFKSVVSESDGRRTYKMSKEAARHYGLKRYYGMTGEEYGAMLAAQKGVCAICDQPETAMFKGVPKVMHVDHDHATGKVRGLLCGCCNGGLGLFKDNRGSLLAAVRYLDKHSDAQNIVPLKELP